MRQRIDDALRAFGLVQGLAFAWATGAGAILAGVVTGALAVYSVLPWWSIALIALGAFVITIATISFVVQKRRPPPPTESPITPIIEKGIGLRARLATDASVDPSPDDRGRWKVRVQDWIDEAEEVVGRLAPHRLPAFKVDYLWTGMSLGNEPAWKADLLVELDIRIDRLSVLRASV